MIRRQFPLQGLLETDHIRVIACQLPAFYPDTIAGTDLFDDRAAVMEKRNDLLLIRNGDIEAAKLRIVQYARQPAYRRQGKSSIGPPGYTFPFKLLRKILLRERMRQLISYQAVSSH